MWWHTVKHWRESEEENWRMEWVASTLYTASERGVSSITTADAHTSAASSRLNWCPRRFKWTLPFRRKTKSGFCACAFTFQTQSKVGEIGDRLPGRGWGENPWLFFLWPELVTSISDIWTGVQAGVVLPKDVCFFNILFAVSPIKTFLNSSTFCMPTHY